VRWQPDPTCAIIAGRAAVFHHRGGTFIMATAPSANPGTAQINLLLYIWKPMQTPADIYQNAWLPLSRSGQVVDSSLRDVVDLVRTATS
jgi:hypothetical protein